MSSSAGRLSLNRLRVRLFSDEGALASQSNDHNDDESEDMESLFIYTASGNWRIGEGLMASAGGDSELVEDDGEMSNDRFRLKPMVNIEDKWL